jgi:hypothetical protein
MKRDSIRKKMADAIEIHDHVFCADFGGLLFVSDRIGVG